MLTNLILLAHQLGLTFALRVIDNGLGLPVYNVPLVDYAFLAADKKAALPSQVQQAMRHFGYFSCSVHHLLVCNI